MATKATTDLAKKEKGGALAVFDYGDDAGSGFQNQTNADIQIPILAIIQAQSPQIQKSKPEFLEAAQVGMLYNPVTNEVIDGDTGLLFVPAVTDHRYMEWIPRDSGGGLVASHDLDSDVVAAARATGAKPNDFKVGENDLTETYYIYGVLVDEVGPTMPVILAMTKSKIKVYRKWNSTVRLHQINVNGRRMNPPLFANLVRIKTFEDQNANGDVFQNFVLAPAKGNLYDSLLKPDDLRFLEAKKIGELFAAGGTKVDHATEVSTTGTEETVVPF